MNIEEKARAYDKALKWMRELYPGLHGATKEDAEHYFPELRESEDERMVRIIENVICTNEGEVIAQKYGLKLTDLADWLEKQKEQKPALKQTLDAYKISDERATAKMEGRIEGRQDVINNPEEYGLQKPAEINEYEIIKKHITEDLLSSEVNKRLKECGWYVTEQKPINNSTREKIISRATSEKQVVLISESSGNAEIGWDTRSLEDAKKLLEYGLAFINKSSKKPAEKQDYSGLTDLERAIHRGFLSAGVENVPVTIIKETANECKWTQTIANENANAEWSEEDERMLERAIHIIVEYSDIDEKESEIVQKWLKSLRPSWKPSEEQMEGLKFFLEFHRSQRNVGTVNWREYDAIESLYEELKKL